MSQLRLNHRFVRSFAHPLNLGILLSAGSRITIDSVESIPMLLVPGRLRNTANRVRALDSDISREREEEWPRTRLVCGPARPSGRRLALGPLIPLSLFFALPHSLRPWFHPPESELLPLPRPFPLSGLRITFTHPHTTLNALKKAFRRPRVYMCVE